MIAEQVAKLGDGDPKARIAAMDMICDLIDPDYDRDISYEAQRCIVTDDDRTVPTVIQQLAAPAASEEQMYLALRVLVKFVHDAPQFSDLVTTHGAGHAALAAMQRSEDPKIHERAWGMLGNIVEQGVDSTIAQLCDEGVAIAAVAALTTVLNTEDADRDYELLEVISNILAELSCRPFARKYIHQASGTLPAMRALAMADRSDLTGFEDVALRHAVTVHSLVALACLLGRESNVLRVETNHLKIVLADLDLGLRHEMRSITSIFRLRRVPLPSSRMLAISELAVSDDFKAQLLEAGVLRMCTAALTWDAAEFQLPNPEIQTRNTHHAAVRALFALATCDATRAEVSDDAAAMTAISSLANTESNVNLKTAARALLNMLRDDDSDADDLGLGRTISTVNVENVVDIFISFRVRESLCETNMLRDALAEAGVRAYVCESAIDVGEVRLSFICFAPRAEQAL